jgi:hypothetical protein
MVQCQRQIRQRGTKFFANRYNASGDVFYYEADPSEALAYFSGRSEAEIILDFENTSDPHRIKLSRDRKR